MRVLLVVLHAVGSLIDSVSSECSKLYPQTCTSSSDCEAIGEGVWIPVENATNLPGTALLGGRRYTLGQTDEEFTTIIYAPNGGYCTRPETKASNNCTSNATLCESMDHCMYAGKGRWFHGDSSSTCVTNCSHPLVFCDAGRCGSTMGCVWFVQSQSTDDQCFCRENPGIYGNPPKGPSLTWIFWDQPWSLLAFIPACIAILALGYYIFIYNIRPCWQRCRKPRTQTV